MYCIYIRWLLIFEFQLPHPILSPVLATDKKWPLSHFISLTKTRKSADQKCWFLTFKVNYPKLFHWRIPFEVHIFCYWHFLKNSIFKALYLLKLGPFFVSWFPSFGKRYGNDLRVIFYQWPKLCIGLDVEADIGGFQLLDLFDYTGA